MDDLSPLELAVVEAKEWGKETVGIMRSKIVGQDTGSLNKSLRAVVRKDRFGELKAIAFKMERYGVFGDMGGGRGYGGEKARRWYYKKPERVKKPIRFYKGKPVQDERHTDTDSVGKMGTGKRPRNPFIMDTLNDQVPKLADALAAISADIIINVVGNSVKK